MPKQPLVWSGDHGEHVGRDAGARSPLDLQRRRTRTTGIVTGVMVAACAVWAVWPAHSRDLPQRFVQEVTQVTALAPSASFDAAAFDAPLWQVPKEPVVAVASPPPPPPPPLRLQLIAIMHAPHDGGVQTEKSARRASALPTAAGEGGGYRAALYDPDSDTTSVIGVGDVVGGRRVTAIDAQRVTLVLGELSQSLTLDDGAEAAQLQRSDSGGGGRGGRGGAR